MKGEEHHLTGDIEPQRDEGAQSAGDKEMFSITLIHPVILWEHDGGGHAQDTQLSSVSVTAQGKLRIGVWNYIVAP